MDRQKPPEVSEAELRANFNTLRDNWKNDIKLSSSSTVRNQHPAYQEIIGMSEAVVPILLEELRERPDHWFAALTQITGENPTRPYDTFQQRIEKWLVWGEKKGLIKPLSSEPPHS